LVLDNEEATFKAITEIPYQQLQQGGMQSFGTTEFKDVGVELQVTPHVAKDGMVRLHILPKFSVQTGDVLITYGEEGGRTTPQPVVDKREADTIALVQDGQTVVIGGLRKQTINKLVSKVPLLGDIPLLGLLFKFNGEEVVNSELVVFITPYIVEDPVMTPHEADVLEDTNIEPPKPPTDLRLDWLNKKAEEWKK
jgi:type II secretory pathway component GspD/PulD (secretin)